MAVSGIEGKSVAGTGTGTDRVKVAEEKLKQSGITIPFHKQGNESYVMAMMELLENRTDMKYHEINKNMYKNRLDPAEAHYKKLDAYIKRSDVTVTADLRSKLNAAKSIFEKTYADYQIAAAGYDKARDAFFGA